MDPNCGLTAALLLGNSCKVVEEDGDRVRKSPEEQNVSFSFSLHGPHGSWRPHGSQRLNGAACELGHSRLIHHEARGPSLTPAVIHKHMALKLIKVMPMAHPTR